MSYIYYWIIAIIFFLLCSVAAVLIFKTFYKKFISDDKNKNKEKHLQKADAIKKKFKAVLLSVSVPVLSVLLLGLIVNSALFISEDSKIIDTGYVRAKENIEEFRQILSEIASENGLILVEENDYYADDESVYVRIYGMQKVGYDIHIELGYDRIKGEEYYSLYVEADSQKPDKYISGFPSDIMNNITKAVSGLKSKDGKDAVSFLSKTVGKIKSYPYEKYERLDVCGYWVQSLTVTSASGSRHYTFIETGLTVNSVKD